MNSSCQSHLDRSPAKAWRDQLALNSGQRELWGQLQRAHPDRTMRLIHKQLEKMEGSQGDRLEIAERIRHWQLVTGCGEKKLIDLVRKVARAPLPLGSKREKLWINPLGDFSIRDTYESLKVGAQIAPHLMPTLKPIASQISGGSLHLDRALTLLDMSVAISEVWSLEEQIEALEQLFTPISSQQEREALETRQQLLKDELEQLKGSSAFFFDPNCLAKCQQLMLIEARLAPERNPQLMKTLENELHHLRRSRDKAEGQFKAGALGLSVELLDVLLQSLDGAGFYRSLFSTIWKARGAWQSSRGALEELERAKKLKREFKYSVQKLSQMEQGWGGGAPELVSVVRKVHQIYWQHRRLNSTESLILKGFKWVASLLGGTSAAFKLLGGLGVVVAGAGLVAGIGYASIGLLMAVTLFKVGLFLYRKRRLISLHAQRCAGYIDQGLLRISPFKVDKKRWVAVRGRLKRVEKQLASYHTAQKTAGVSLRLLRQLSRSIEGYVDRSLTGRHRAQLIHEAIVGDTPKYLDLSDQEPRSDEEVQDRLLASIIAKLSD